MEVPAKAEIHKEHSQKAKNLEEQSQPFAVPMASIQDDDERLLARIGYKQV